MGALHRDVPLEVQRHGLDSRPAPRDNNSEYRRSFHVEGNRDAAECAKALGAQHIRKICDFANHAKAKIK